MGHKQARRFLECINDNSLIQVTEESRRGSSLLDLILTNKEELVCGAKVGVALVLGTRQWWS